MRSIGVLVAVTLAAGIVLISWRQVATTHQIINNTSAGELTADRRFGQTFRASFSGLYRVDVVMATYRRQNEGPITFHLAEGIKGPELVTITVEAAHIRDNASQRFVFAPIVDSADREFYFYLEAPEASPGNAITVWQTDFDSYPSGCAYVDDQPTDGDLRFVAYYRSSPSEVWTALTERVRTWHPYLWQARWLVLIAAAALTLGTGVLLGELLIAGTKKV
ncbi:MAG: hypothetical protein JW918_11040 [Anaerolineae bacterium]|nr:hypothetical protein [Anaerolineae bacterium]